MRANVGEQDMSSRNPIYPPRLAGVPTARQAPTVQGRVDKQSIFVAICDGVKSGLFGYADSGDAPIMRGPDAPITPSQVKFSGLLIGEDVPLPVTIAEIERLMPPEGRVSVKSLYETAAVTCGAARVSNQIILSVLQRCVAEGSFGYAPNENDVIQTGKQSVSLDGYVGQPEILAPDTHVIVLSGSISSVELANVVKAVMNLSKLGDSKITLTLRLELKGEVNEHSISVALNELRQRVPDLKVEELR